MIDKKALLVCMCTKMLVVYPAENVNTQKMQPLIRRPKLTIIPRLAVYSVDAKTAYIHGPVTVNGSISIEGTLTINGRSLTPSGLTEIPLSIANGGTNATAMANTNGVVYFDGSSLSTTDAGTAGQLLTSRGPSQSPVFTAGNIATIRGNAGVISGATVTIQGGNNITTTGDNNSTMTVNVSGTTNHAVQIGNSSGSLSSLAVGVTDTVLLGNTGADPSFGTVPNGALTNSSITLASGTGISITGGSPVSLGGTATINLSIPVTIANGGTNATSMTNTDGVVYFDGTLLNTTTVGTAGQLLASNGTGNAPTFQAFTITTDSGSVNGNALSLMAAAGSGSTLKFSGSGTAITLATSDSNTNTVIGVGTGVMGAGTANTIFGQGAVSGAEGLSSLSNNCVFGQGALPATNSGSANNCVFGYNAAANLTSGNSNIMIGAGAGNSQTGINGQIYIGSAGVFPTDVDNTLRIGDNITKTYIGGINGVAVSSNIPVFISSTSGQLGTVSSSRKYKKNIQDIDLQEIRLLDLRPVTFNYVHEEVAGELHFGLIAEEVEEVIPALVVRDKDGEIYSVKYHELPVLLLAQIKQLFAENADCKNRIVALEEVIGDQKENV
ncbi:MAG: tail fiber domain-containing protein [Candidatus Babeliales bacterium]